MKALAPRRPRPPRSEELLTLIVLFLAGRAGMRYHGGGSWEWGRWGCWGSDRPAAPAALTPRIGLRENYTHVIVLPRRVARVWDAIACKVMSRRFPSSNS